MKYGRRVLRRRRPYRRPKRRTWKARKFGRINRLKVEGSYKEAVHYRIVLKTGDGGEFNQNQY